MSEGTSLSLVALGKAGAITIEVDRRPDDGLLLTVEAPAWCLRFDLVGPGAVAELAEFLRAHSGKAEFAEFVVGSLAGMAVWVIKDDEFADRLFLRAAGDGALVDFTLSGETASDFAAAVTKAAAEVEE